MNLNLINPQKIAVSRQWWLIVGVAVLGVVGVTAWRSAQVLNQREEQVAVLPEITSVTALGRLEPDGETIDLTAPTSAQESRIQELLVKEGDVVEAGQVIAILDNRDRMQAALQKAEQQVQIARAQLAQVEAGAQTGELQAQVAEIARLEADQAGNISAQRATVARLDAEVQHAQIEAQRYGSLYQQGAVSASQRDAKQLTYTTAQRQLQEAQASLGRIESAGQEQITQARATLDRIAEVRPVDVDAAEADVQSEIAGVAEAQANLDQAYVRSPRDGQVLKIHTRSGETIGDEGIATLGHTQQMMVVAEVYQDDIAKVNPGQRVEITTPTIDDVLQGTVQRIGLQVESQQVVNEDPAANIDAKVVEVHIQLDDPDGETVATLTNLQVTAAIQIK
ncbi:HlyD family efflux transporter periplasmic adaptor subunit [Leptolyngbyaceae cyanobacterium CCMR0082]|uniref:HlyD family efflux transporter periplasmic adaptor subunit n=1 Tax=Adonisia turfae CCMR0082 TaxID=2304604 RepID=A0A6M0S3A8_9CYAN|nr:ABC exporter membrane fusion protein [Adonisia turfae]NEZ62543.1 HlyD family efflux transporter periplasmic adaptor subunit [Adonisia turfae CCMR0082]